jgi:HSP20 family molecular chaperone IbpA
MARVPSLSSPFLLGFDEIERALDRVAKAADGYPPYNIERMARENGQPERLRITLAVAGFAREELDVTIEESQLVIRGRQNDEQTRQYLHRGIAARQFQRTFVLADGMEVLGADLKNGLLSIDLARPEPERVVKTIAINEDHEELDKFTVEESSIMNKDGVHSVNISTEALAHLGDGEIAYIKTIRSEDVPVLFPQAPEIAPGLELFALHAADGTPIMITDSREAAIASARSNELQTLSVH